MLRIGHNGLADQLKKGVREMFLVNEPNSLEVKVKRVVFILARTRFYNSGLKRSDSIEMEFEDR